MIETLTIVTLIFLYLNFFRPGKTPMLESPLVETIQEAARERNASINLLLTTGSIRAQVLTGHLISHKVQHASLRGAKRRGNPDFCIQNALLTNWIASLRSQ